MKEIIVRAFDDLDYTRTGERNEASATVVIGLDGSWRELDLTKVNDEIIRHALEEWMEAGREPENEPVPPRRTHYKYNAAPEQVEFFRGLREWCKAENRMNSAGTGWAYQTNKTLKYYYSEKLKREYREYLENSGK